MLLSYDPNGNLQSVTDARTGVTQYTYDAMNRVAPMADSLLKPRQYANDLAGHLIQFTDR